MPGVFPDYPVPVIREADGGLELNAGECHLRHEWAGSRSPTSVIRHRRTAVQQLCRIRARAESADKEERHCLVRTQR
jgi:hypothetical protein